MTARAASRPVIAVSQRRDPTGPPHDEIRDALDVRLAEFVLSAGGLPVPVPSALGADGLVAWLAAVGPDAVLLSGGADIGRDPARDTLEAGLLNYAAEDRRPVLGICRGLQYMAHAAGTPLVPVAGHVACRHRLAGEIAREVNSFHAVALSGTPAGYRALAHAPDGTIEAIAHSDLPWEGWMWHPERETRPDPDDIDRFRRIIA
ncbi:gamma-glutamyl-gamma-aminobutyrate hydrolase family protein [Jannaschia sp. S6380]|uniref:gamma-glutamyl-gamma-aminobutyrate hydrolase family protein n=1 Tax=Jannaschia sp. S6380 TaxID=2926408 RepID=UPI001FF59C3C|nr:gamma-glutamyl-gamma-aminobutyrate hydrolase family protein [Jannaschia sp. S6380]MCK0168414.1 gamma-glutamyl-gamma-aminobutyrate hydrolase family protein [Jannaschia sp. S6380]